uniref:RING-type domain-containing protein n=1 Tax=Trichobilharzia regenti TaxID=157069 RepID=A0AA85KDV9_TRIRE|nr:unnamed protein product [Trichobilharzia regenti]
MHPRQLYPSHHRGTSHIPAVQRMPRERNNVRVTLDGHVVNDNHSHLRMNRHTNDDPVVFNRSRLQWYDSNTRGQLSPEPPTRLQPSGLIRMSELEKLPVSTYRVERHEPTNSDQAHAANSFISSPNTSTCIPVINRNQSSTPLSPGSAYLQPESKSATLFDIQPIQSSPSRGRPECEICLNEYQNYDRLRHLPCGHAFHMNCIDVWLRESTTCPKCRAGVRTGLNRLRLADLRLRDQRISVTSAAAAPVRAIRPRLGASTSGAQEQIRTTNSRRVSTTTSATTTTTTRTTATASSAATSTSRRVVTARITVGISSSDTSTSRISSLPIRPTSSSSCSATTTTSTSIPTSRTISATTGTVTVSSTGHRTNSVASRRIQGGVLNSNSGQSGTAMLTSAVAQSTNSRRNQNELRSNPHNAQANITCSNGVSESMMARQKAVEAAIQREAEFRRRQENEANGSSD